MKKIVPSFITLKIAFTFFLCIISTMLIGQVTNPRTLSNEWAGYGIGDPYIMKYRGKFYLYCSTRDDMTGVKVWSSWDLTNWTDEGLCSTDPITKGAYAPEVIYYNGTFYMYTSPAGNGHYVLSSSSPTGPFTVQTGNQGHSIDGDVLIDDDGKLYFSHASPSGILGNTMSNPLSIDGPDQTLNAYLNGWTEGSTIFKRNGLYYITYTGNHVFSPGYRVSYGTSTTPMGSYTAGNNDPVILNSEGSFYGLGHSGSVVGPDLDTWYIAYHNLLGPGTIGPLRKLNIDPMGFNGTKMVVYGPTNWAQPAPALPTFYDRFDRTTIGSSWANVNGGNWGIYNQELMWQDQTGTSTWYRQISSQASATEYTAEFNMKEVGRGGNNARFGAVFSYIDENNFGSALFSSYDNTLEVNFIVNGVATGVQTYPVLPGWDYQKWHALRVEKHTNVFKVYVDGMLKSTQQVNGLGAGKIGVTTMNDHADFGYTAFSNYHNGSAIFDFYKPIPGTIEAVHYNSGGEGVGYHDVTSGNTGGLYRTEDVDIRDCPEGGENVGWNSTGEWYKYNVNVQSAGLHHIGLRYATTMANTKVRFWCDGADISGIVTLPATGDWNNWVTQIIKKVNLPAGYHTIKLETVAGEFDFYTIRFEAAADVVTTSDNFDAGYSSGWNYTDGTWNITSGTATINGWGKRTIGNTGWTDYSVVTDIQCPSTGNGGLIFRVKNPAKGGAGNDPQLGADFYQGYFAGIQTSGITLGKQNYDWTSLNFKSQSLTAGQWYKLKASMNGDTIRVYLNDMTTPIITYIDTNPFISGKAGLRAFNTQLTFDNFQIIGNNNQAPVVSIASPTNNTVFTAPASITIKANVSDADGTIRKVEFFNGSTSLGTTDTAPYNFTWNSVASGTYTITAIATDDAGNTTTSTPVTIFVDTPPTIGITSPANNAAFTSPASVTITTNAADADGSVSKVEFYNGATLIGTVSSSPFNFTWTNIAAGNYTITAKATDDKGLFTTSSPINIVVNANPTITFANITKTYGEASFAVSATSNSSGAITYSITAGSQYASITSGGQVTLNGAGSVTIQASQAAAPGYNAGTATATLTINKAILTATADNKSKVYNTANPTLTITYSGFVNSESSSVLTTQPTVATTATQTSNVGTYPITLTGGTAANYNITLVNGTITITQATPTITYTGATNGTQGTSIALSTTSNSTGAISYSVTNGTGSATVSGSNLNLTSAGTVTLTVSVAATTNYTSGSTTVTITINNPVNQNPSITFNNITKTYGDASFTVSASSNSSGAITYSITSGSQFATITSGGQVTLNGAGSVTIQASQAVGPGYNAGTATATLTINKATLTATADNQTKVYNTSNPTLTISYSGFVNSDNVTSITVPSVSTTATQTSNVGSYPISLSGGTAANYSITLVNGTLTITQATPIITYTGATSGTQGTSIALSATSNSTGAISYSVSNGTGSATVSGSNLNLTSAGTVILTVNVAATTNNTAASTSVTITINNPVNQNPTITFNDITKEYGDASFIVSATSNSPGSFTYSIIAGGQYATITPSGQVTIIEVGTVTIQATEASAGGYNSGIATATLTINKSSKAGLTYTGTTSGNVGDQITLGATSASTGAITYQILSGTATLSGNALTLTGTGTVKIQITVAGDDHYAPQTIVQDITVSQATAVVHGQSSTVSIETYPNPATDYVTIKIIGLAKVPVGVGLYDIEGKKLIELAGEELMNSTEMTLSMSQLGQGMYILKVETEDGMVVNKVNK